MSDVNHERARGQGSLLGEPLVAPAGSSYPAGYIYDYVCLGCGSCNAAHDENSDCWRVLKSDDELRRYDEAMEIADEIRYGKPSIVVIDAEQAAVRGSLCSSWQDQRQAPSEDGETSVSM